LTGSERSVLCVGSFGHALCHVATLVLAQVVAEAGVALDLAPERMGPVVALAPFLMGLLAVPAGALGDRFGLRRVYKIYLAALTAGAALAAFAPGAPSFLAAVALIGAASAFHHPVALAWIGEALPSHRAKAMGIHGFVGHFGSTLAPLLVLSLAHRVGWRHTYSAIAAAAAALFCVLLATRATAGEQASSAARRSGGCLTIPWRLALVPALLAALLAMVCNGLVHQGFLSTWTSLVRAHVGELSHAPATAASLAPLAERIATLLPAGGSMVALAGVLATVVLAFGSLGELLGGRLARRGGTLLTYAAMNAISAVGLLVAALASGPLLLAAGALFAFCHFGTQPIENELIARRVDPRVRGLAYGFKFVITFALGSVATTPAVRGWQSQGFSFVLWALFGVTLGGIAATLLIAWRERTPHRSSRNVT
jgi:MFS family permease